jgi:hypothetical protein
MQYEDILPFKCSGRVPLKSSEVKFKVNFYKLCFLHNRTEQDWSVGILIMNCCVTWNKQIFLGLIHITQTRWCDTKKGNLL